MPVASRCPSVPVDPVVFYICLKTSIASGPMHSYVRASVCTGPLGHALTPIELEWDTTGTPNWDTVGHPRSCALVSPFAFLSGSSPIPGRFHRSEAFSHSILVLL